ncbi:hypothetical protein B7P43_G17489 [Cryptotermes secundus]|uniref:C2H2-type domain-containing protein n=1 Tax=Cryptotermes secundus TaxID=105785 RepID=A0A2J7QUL2_9NEOP|nr:hypothetical protein B7P43_G17489 [Cryptotermes secundus]
MEAHLVEEEPASVDRKPEAAELREVPVQDAEVMPVGEPKRKRRRDQNKGRNMKNSTRENCGPQKKLAVARRGTSCPLKVARQKENSRKMSQCASVVAWRRRNIFNKSWTRGNYESRMKLAATCRKISHRATVARCWRNDFKKEALQGTFGCRRKDLALRSCSSKRLEDQEDLQSQQVQTMNQVLLRRHKELLMEDINKDWTLWKCRPPPKRKRRLQAEEQPACTFIQVGKNLVPDLPDPFTCCWDDCERTFNNSQMYFNHVQTHVHCNPRGNNVEGGVPCSWRGCKSVFRSMYKLADHVRSHTQEKLVGCPTCGGLFATKTKFFDHCKRQVPLELQGYQCSHCSKYYPSERLLRDHMRHHVNHYKCSFCDMTCPTPSSLSVHIRYRHLDSKPFKCSFCEYT